MPGQQASEANQGRVEESAVVRNQERHAEQHADSDRTQKNDSDRYFKAHEADEKFQTRKIMEVVKRD